MSDALRKKRSVRRGYREVLTKRLSEANAILEGIVDDMEVDPVKLGQLKLSVSEKLICFQKLNHLKIFKRMGPGPDLQNLWQRMGGNGVSYKWGASKISNGLSRIIVLHGL